MEENKKQAAKTQEEEEKQEEKGVEYIDDELIEQMDLQEDKMKEDD